MSETEILGVLSEIKDPETGRSLNQQGQIRDIDVRNGRVTFTLALSTHSAPLWKDVQTECRDAVRQAFPDAQDIEIREAVHVRPPMKIGQIGLTVKSVVAVGSGKGGVGKSTIAACLAYGLKRSGCAVGLLDADVYGPSLPHLLGVNQRPEVVEKQIRPIEIDGLVVMSMGFLVPPGEAVVWRGPMLHGAITQFLRDTMWGELDYLVIDMPPGTGDIALTLSQLLPLTGAVVVCTPQDVALLDAVKAIAMFRKVSIPVLGMVENMSYFLCPDNGKRYDIFGSGGARRKAEELEIPFLGEVPINIQIRVNGDLGATRANFTDPQAAPFLERIAYNLSRNLAHAARTAPPMPTLPVL